MSIDAHEQLVLTLSLAQEMAAFCLAREQNGAEAIPLNYLRPWLDRLPDAIPEALHFVCRRDVKLTLCDAPEEDPHV